MIKEIRQAIKEYKHNLTYNINELGYYWKIKPDCSLLTFNAKRAKKAKARIITNFCYNVLGTNKLLLWFIGTAKRPNYFWAKYLFNFNTIDVMWRHNKLA
jgi:hypothetical protein